MSVPKNKPVHLNKDGHYLMAEYCLALADDILMREGDPTFTLAAAQVHATLASVPESMGVEIQEHVAPHIVERVTPLPGDIFAKPQKNGKENA